MSHSQRDTNSPIAITPLTMAERADDYPYQAPQASYVISQGCYRLIQKQEMPDLSGRVAVLSVGSNRSPQQLLRKFGSDAYLPVTRARLHDCDIIHSACFSYYGAVPCSAFPSQGTSIMLNAVWLTADQLQIMHDTEAVGIAYDYCRWDDGIVEILDAPQPEAIYGYATRLGFLQDHMARPYGLSSLRADNRQFTSLSQQEGRLALYQALPSDLQQGDITSFMTALIGDKAFRLTVNERLAESAAPIPSGPWQIIPATPKDADSFL